MNTTEKEEKKGFSAFKEKEKLFKYYSGKQTDFSQCLDLESLDKEPKIEKFKVIHPRTGKTIQGFKFPEPSGLIVLKKYTEPKLQLELSRKAINEYIRKPHRTNLYIYQKTNPAKEPLSEKDTQYTPTAANTTPPDTQSYNKQQFIASDPSRYHFNTKIRWSNMGRQYDWSARNYMASESPITPELIEITKEVIDMLDLGNYRAEALLINYYGERNFMGGHLDDAEPDQQHPIVSFSFGLSCVFLIGGRTKNVDPYAVRLDSGDVMVMSEDSRCCFHGSLM